MAQNPHRELLIENFRCLVGSHSIPLRPLTLLIGENSAGKSTVLKALSAVFGSGFPFMPDFSGGQAESLGFSDLASRQAVQGKKKRSFELGIREHRDGGAAEVRATIVTDQYDIARTGSIKVKTPQLQITVKQPTRHKAEVQLKIGSAPSERGRTSGLAERETLQGGLLMTLFGTKAFKADQISTVAKDLRSFTFDSTTSHFLDPIRSKPHRVYSRNKLKFFGDGSHFATMIATLPPEYHGVVSRLNAFGADSGLYESVVVRPTTEAPGAPYELLVSIGGLEIPLDSVGYGVSQCLPFIVDALGLRENSLLAIEQPEVHLHPRAQAAVGSFLSQVASTKQAATIVLETHSDYLLDRVRIEVAAGTLSPDSVGILFFDKPADRTLIHHIELDDMGNIINPPKGYRSFFLREEDRLLNRGQDVRHH